MKCVTTDCRNEGWAAEPVPGSVYCFTHLDAGREAHPGKQFRQLTSTSFPYTGSHRGHREVKVYFFHCPGYIKIGSSINPRARLRDFRSGFEGSVTPRGIKSSELECIGWVHAPRSYEKELHARYAALQVAGEWFAATPELEADIAALLEGSQVPA